MIGFRSNAPVTVVSPRPERRPSRACRRDLEALGVEYVELDLRSPVPAYGPSFKVLALSWCGARSGPATLVQLDSDAIFLAEPDLRAGASEAAARPVDVPGICSTGPGGSYEPVWRRMADASGVDIDALPFVRTTIGGHRVRASYNGGLVAAPRSLFPIIEDVFLRIVRADLGRPLVVPGFVAGAGPVDDEGARYWGTSQAAITLAALASRTRVRILGNDHNVPAHMLDDLSEPRAWVTHLHYHWLYSELATRRVLDHPRLAFSTEQRAWIAARTASSITKKRRSLVSAAQRWTKRLIGAG